MSGFLGSGDLHYNRVVDGVSQGWLSIGNATKFEIKEDGDLKERASRQKADYGTSLNSVAIKKPATISIVLDDINAENLALAFLGSVVDGAVNGGTVTDEVHVANLDKSLKTVHRKISSVVVKDTTGVTTHVLDTDYEIVSAAMGFIKPLSTGAISEDDPLKVSYTYATIASTKVHGGTNSSVKLELLLDGENFSDQSETVVNVWEAVLSPQDGVDFLAEDFVSITLNGTLNKPDGKTSAYETELGVTYT